MEEKKKKKKKRYHRQGRYMKYGEKTISVRVPVSLEKECREWIFKRSEKLREAYWKKIQELRDGV